LQGTFYKECCDFVGKQHFTYDAATTLALEGQQFQTLLIWGCYISINTTGEPQHVLHLRLNKQKSGQNSVRYV